MADPADNGVDVPGQGYGAFMATTQSTVDFLVEQMAGSGRMRYKKMFGEYAVYCDEKVVALVCNDQLYVKKSKASTTFLDPSHEAAPFPGAKNYLKVPPEHWDDSEWLSLLIRRTADELPLPKAKAKKK
ncbi:MAG: TfoX/Sxy family protein [Herpetosiphon sp.]